MDVLKRNELSDNIIDTVNYQSVYRIVKDEMAQPSHLLEHVARRILDSVCTQFPEIEHAKVKVSKMNPPMGGKMQCVSVSLTN
jgi:dihydroneopterin aldolase